ncbi:hypothetical protein ONZ45_g1327 [Pleurotus djamor]|nr:hypothetical protein ONZ45_g1327 [Pleurotus djamor]
MREPLLRLPQVPEQHDDEDSRDIYVSDDFKRLTVHDPEENLFFGKSSGVALLQTAMNMKQALSGRPRAEHVKNPQVWSQRRECFWTTPSWESSPPLGPPTLSLQFPEEDLMPVLIDNYFENFNLLLPLLHRPTFERSMKDGLHLIHDTFGAIVLLVCALGSRQSDDPRVCLSDVEHPEYSRGWKYFNQVQIVRQSVLSAPTLYDLQLYCLAIEFLRDSSVGHSCWTLVGIALRLAQEVGVHKWRRKNRAPTVENELWMRAFWILLSLDRTLSSLLGRSCTIGSEELDLDLPLEVDDEYWEHPDPEKAFRQPDDKPSLIMSFNCSLRLMHILGTALRTLYITQKSRIALGLIGAWEHPIVSQLDSKLNQWLDTLPPHHGSCLEESGLLFPDVPLPFELTCGSRDIMNELVHAGTMSPSNSTHSCSDSPFVAASDGSPLPFLRDITSLKAFPSDMLTDPSLTHVVNTAPGWEATSDDVGRADILARGAPTTNGWTQPTSSPPDSRAMSFTFQSSSSSNSTSNPMDLWTNAPANFDLDDWGQYLANVRP